MINSKFDLTGKVAIVTGLYSGLGQGMALGLAEAGADIVGVDYKIAEDTEKQVKALGRKYKGFEEDLFKIDNLEKIIQESVKEFGHVDILINNAGIIRRNPAVDFSEKDWDDVMNINIKTVFFFSQAIAKQFIKQKTGGKIINIASMLSFQGGILVPSYTASKSGIMGITRLMANEWANYNINVNAIAPGYMATAATEALRNDEVRSKNILERIPAGKWGTPDDLKGPAIFLASEASNYINGYTIAVDGGWLAR